jgi:tetratricopeptide (TPR) repeat protein
MIKKLFVFLILSALVLCSGYKKPDKYVIESEKNTFYHNNVGLNYLKDRTYYAAIQEFKIAISLSPSTQASAIFYNNLGETYMFIGYPDLAQDCFENAIKLYGLNFQYYLNIVNCYKAQGLASSKIASLQVSPNIYDRIKLGILYIETGETRRGVNLLDEISMANPDLLITPAIRQYISNVIKEKL